MKDSSRCGLSVKSRIRIMEKRIKKTKRDWLPGYIARKCTETRLRRRRRSLQLMEGYKGLYDCAECIHGLIDSCRDPLPNGCEYFADEVAGRRFTKDEPLFDMDALARQHTQEIGQDCRRYHRAD